MRHRIKTTILTVLTGAALCFGQSNDALAQPFLVSGYGDTIYSSFLNAANGLMDAPRKVATQAKPSFFSQHPKLPIIYAVSETMRNDEKSPAELVAYEVEFSTDGKIRRLVELNRQRINGDIGCHVNIDSQGRLVFVSNYVNGSVVAFALDKDGKIGSETCNVVHQITDGKTRSNGHCSVLTPDEKNLLVCDLGLDRVFNYVVNYTNGTLSPANQPYVSLKQGAGPRHLTFHPDGKHLFIINELDMTMTSAQWDANSSQIRIIDTVDTIPNVPSREGFSTAEVLVHPNGKFVYGSNRGHNSIAVFHFDSSTGKLQLVETTSTTGKTPRNFRLDPSGKYMLVENQQSDNVVVFQIDPNNGKLTATENSIEVSGPTCLRFIRK